MYENLNKNSIIDVASTLINEMNSYTPEQQNQLLVEYIIIPFFFYIVIWLDISIIFGKKFCTFPTKNSSSRMRDLLKNIGLEKRIWSEQFRLDEEIDYKKVQLKLIAFSEKSKQYLKEALD